MIETGNVGWIGWPEPLKAMAGWSIVYVLMTNHHHLFVEAPVANLSRGMQYLNGSYAGFFNVRQNASVTFSRDGLRRLSSRFRDTIWK